MFFEMMTKSSGYCSCNGEKRMLDNLIQLKSLIVVIVFTIY